MKVIQLELNEVSRSIIDHMIARGELPHFQRLNADFKYTTTLSTDAYEEIEPWIQWVSAHTGKSFAEHQVFRLGDAEQLQYTQIWETLSDQGLESAILGSMNAKRGRMQGGLFFPDPWTKDGKTNPENLQPLWDLVASKVQTHATAKLTITDLLKGLGCCLKYRIPGLLYLKIATQLVTQKLNPKKKWKMAALFDELLAAIFLHVLRTSDFQYYTLFLNACAHYQHHYWREFRASDFSPGIHSPDADEGDDPISHGYQAYDRIVGQVLRAIAKQKDVLLLIATAFTQEPYLGAEAEGGMNYYRLNDHQDFISSLGLSSSQVYPLMSRDWQLVLPDEGTLHEATELLRAITVDDEALFSVQQNGDLSLFVHTAVTKALPPLTQVLLKQKPLGEFDQLFTNIAIKSGHHIPEGSLWLSSVPQQHKLLNPMPLTDLYDLTLKAIQARRA